MAEFLQFASGFVSAMVVLGMVRIVRGPTRADRMMAAQLLGTGGIAALLLRSDITDTPSVIDVALVLALLAAFASVAFVVKGAREASGEPEASE
ncbi:MAG TPA: monovalent cation/H+ antiporter complex subunit F [Rhodomicrobium sp.]|nr:monovalent cation/H+ antiporter complex subunit F [Rhodomicrobium sp.]